MSDGIRNAPGAATTPPLKTVLMTPSTQTRGVRVDVDVMNLDDIPGAMDKMGWKVSAQMMRRWFATKPAWEMPATWRNGRSINYLALPQSQIDDQIIKMKWLLGFKRLSPVLEDLCQNWNNPKGIDVLRERLKAKGWETGRTITLGQRLETAQSLDLTCQVNSRIIGRYMDTFDDLYGSIFRATLKLAVVGKAFRSILSKKDIFEVEKIGVYLRDTYDFNADSFDDATVGLGVWSKRRMLSKIELTSYSMMEPWQQSIVFDGFVPLRNNDFRRWQKKKDEGGDFFVFFRHLMDAAQCQIYRYLEPESVFFG